MSKALKRYMLFFKGLEARNSALENIVLKRLEHIESVIPVTIINEFSLYSEFCCGEMLSLSFLMGID